MKRFVFDADTGESEERDMTLEEIAELEADAPAPILLPDPATVVYAVDLWTRLDGGEDGNSGEVAQVIGEMEQQPIRIRKIFDSATSYRSDHELWPLLQQIATTLFGEERAAQILAPSSQ
ncbi:hypothetical protein [Agrobacterium tumefaciens]|uniref:hypothetical protein n=1 Tax=Agrobacterium tumefaciens TaxID=358 RepID=UPI00278015A1|nr:hypothetical protein [Agrobacterium tumefaciens]MDP9788709.1 hypothetical protein [Agrobacterium tumefaciens]